MLELLQTTTSTTERLAVTTAIVLVVVGVRYGVRRFRQRWSGEFGTLPRLGLSTVIAAITGLGILALIFVWGLGEELIRAHTQLELTKEAPKIVLGLIILGGAYGMTDFVGEIIRKVVGSRERVSRHQQEVLYRLTQLAIYSVAFLIVIGLFTQNLGGLLIGAGFLGIVVGMAARQTLGAALAGVVLMFSRPFEVGDWVEIGDHEGTVTEITIVNTRVQTFDGEFVTIPNDQVGGNAVVDRSKNGQLRIEVEVGVDYEDDPEYAADVALDVVQDVDNVLSGPAPDVIGKRFGDSAVVLGVRFWIDNPSSRKRWRTRTAVINRVHEAFTEEGITIPFPQQTLSAREEGSVAVGRTAAGGASSEADSADGESAAEESQ
ncbi:mechanosensitive ion channel family protein [Haloparvum sp. AD34]